MRGFWLIALLIDIALLGAACATAPSDLEHSKAVCTEMGFQQGADDWRDCVLDLEVAWRHGRYRMVSSPEEQQRFCNDLGFQAGTDDLRFCMAELQAAAAHSHAAGLLYDDRNRCTELGFKEGSDELRRCLVLFEVARRHRSSAGTRRW